MGFNVKLLYRKLFGKEFKSDASLFTGNFLECVGMHCESPVNGLRNSFFQGLSLGITILQNTFGELLT